MPIRRIPKTVSFDASNAIPQSRQEIASPPPRHRRIAPSSIVQPEQNASVPISPIEPQLPCSGERPRQKRGHARKDANGKWQPTADYDVGFARTPKKHQFDGSRPGPGRPKGSRSQDSYLRDELEQVRTIRIDGKTRRVKNRELLAKLMVANALEKKSEKALSNAHEHARRLYPDTTPSKAGVLPLGEASLDETVLRHLFAGLALGEPREGTGDPLADLLRQPLGPDADDDENWREGDWDALGEDRVDD